MVMEIMITYVRKRSLCGFKTNIAIEVEKLVREWIGAIKDKQSTRVLGLIYS